MSKQITHRDMEVMVGSIKRVTNFVLDHYIKDMTIYIEQQEKQEQLLELYKKYFRNLEIENILDFDELEELVKQIKELENE